VRKVRVTLRVQATDAAFRGSDADFANTGFSQNALRRAPDFEVSFEVTPRNMNLGR